MKTNNLKSLIGAAALCATLAVPQLASAAVTPPVGYVKLELAPESDTLFSLPMNRPMVYSGLASGISGNVISIANSDFTADEFVYDETNQNESYYVIFTTGALEGRKFDVTINSVNSVTLDPDYAQDDSSLEIDIETLINGASSGDTFQIRPHWTLNTLLPDGGVLPVSSSPDDANGQIIEFPSNLNDSEFLGGINLSASNSYIYVDQLGWINSLDFTEGIINDKILRGELSYVFRNTSTDILESNVVGDVPTTDNSLFIKKKVIQSDTYVGFQYPIDMSLDELGLAGSVNFTSATAVDSGDGDELIVNSSDIYNASADKVYIHIDGLGWINSADFTEGLITGDVIEAGKGYIIRSVGGASTEELTHSVEMPYDPLAE